MLSEQTIRNRRDALQSIISSQMQAGILHIDMKYVRDLKILNWVLGEGEENE